MTTVLLASSFGEFVNRTVAGGYVFALALVCLLQYLAHMYRLRQSRCQEQHYQNELHGLEEALNQIHKDRALTRIENQILRDFVGQTECEKAMGLLLRRFIPNPDEGFAAFLRFDDRGVLGIVKSRGLSTASIDRLTIDQALLARLKRHETVILEDLALRDTQLLSRLTQQDRAKVRQMYLLSVGEADEVVGVLLTTDLFPAGAERLQQIELAERLMLSIGSHLRQKQQLESQQDQLRMTGEMLELRTIVDRRFDSPVLMIEEFLREVSAKTRAERATLYLSTPDTTTPYKALVRCGEPLQAGLREQWKRHEETLVAAGFAVQELMSFDAVGLEKMRINTLIGSALVVPLIQPQGVIGMLCLTRRQREAFAPQQAQLVNWSGEFLSETILRAVQQASVARQAKLDGLTQLANRRTFDQQAAYELKFAQSAGEPCSLILLDLDRFKAINDTWGHRGGDLVLQSAAEALRATVARIRSGDRALVARYGGEELAVLLPGFNPEGTSRVAEAIRAAIENLRIDFQGQTIRVTASAGYASYPLHGQSVEDLVGAADAALYQAKASGRNRVLAPQSAMLSSG